METIYYVPANFFWDKCMRFLPSYKLEFPIIFWDVPTVSERHWRFLKVLQIFPNVSKDFLLVLKVPLFGTRGGWFWKENVLKTYLLENSESHSLFPETLKMRLLCPFDFLFWKYFISATKYLLVDFTALKFTVLVQMSVLY